MPAAAAAAAAALASHQDHRRLTFCNADATRFVKASVLQVYRLTAIPLTCLPPTVPVLVSGALTVLPQAPSRFDALAIGMQLCCVLLSLRVV